MNSASLTSSVPCTKEEVQINVMVEGLICADTSMDVHLVGEDSFCSPCAPSEGLPTEAMFDGLVCADTSMDLHMSGANVSFDIVQDIVTCTPNETKQ